MNWTKAMKQDLRRSCVLRIGKATNNTYNGLLASSWLVVMAQITASKITLFIGYWVNWSNIQGREIKTWDVVQPGER